MSSYMTSFRVICLVIVTVCCLADALTLIDERNGGELDVIYLGSAKSKGRKKFQNSPVRPFDSLYRLSQRSADNPDGWKNPCHFNPTSRQSLFPDQNDIGAVARYDVQALFYKTESLNRKVVALRQRYVTDRFGHGHTVESLDRELEGVWMNVIPRFSDDGPIPPSGSSEETVRTSLFELFKKAFAFMAELSVFLQVAQIEEGDKNIEPDRNYKQDYLALATHQEYGFFWIFCKLDMTLHAFEAQSPGVWSKPTSVTVTREELPRLNNAIRHQRDYMFLMTLSNFLNTMNVHVKALKQLFDDIDSGRRRSWNY